MIAKPLLVAPDPSSQSFIQGLCCYGYVCYIFSPWPWVLPLKQKYINANANANANTSTSTSTISDINGGK